MTRPFIFVCYAHADNPIVLVEIARLRAAGYEVWYDDHIRGGAEWNEELAQHIQDCGWFLFFASPSSVGSPHCRDELNYGIQHHRNILVVELEPTEVPAGLQLSLNRRQTLFRHKLNDDDYEARLLNALGDPDTGNPRTEKPQPTGVHGSTSPAMAGGGAPASAKDQDMANLEAMLRMPLVRRGGWLRRHWLGAAFTVVALAAFGAFFGRPYFDPAADFDFEGRDWVVLGEFVNDTKVTSLDDSLETGLRVALEQSRFANFIPQSMVRDANRRMERDPNAPLDRAAGIEVAQREGAKALVMGQITEIGKRFNISAELIDVGSGRTVLVVAETAEGLDEVVDTLDAVARELRRELGESLDDIASDSKPLAKVTTPDLEALRAYSLAQQNIAVGDWKSALALLDTALEIDPGFAMAHGQAASAYFGRDLNSPEAAFHWSQAMDNVDRLSRRERLYVEASSAWQKTPEDMERGWRLMSQMYPDEAVGHHNLGMVHKAFLFNASDAEAAFQRATELPNPYLFASFHALAQTQMAQGRFPEALANLKQSLDMSGNPIDFALADAHTIARHYTAAEEVLDLATTLGNPVLQVQASLRRVGMLADKGDLDAALAAAHEAKLKADEFGLSNFSVISRAAELALFEGSGDQAELDRTLADCIQRAQQRLDARPETVGPKRATMLALLSRIGVRARTPQALTYVEQARRYNDSPFPLDRAYLALMEAEIALVDGDTDAALKHVESSLRIAELFQAYDSLYRIHRTTGDEEQAQAALQSIIDRRGLAFSENFEHFFGQVFNILDWNRADQASTSGAELEVTLR